MIRYVLLGMLKVIIISAMAGLLAYMVGTLVKLINEWRDK